MKQDMYGAEGKLGNKTYYYSNGKTIARSIVPVKNPKTNLQTLQRVIAKQVNATYKAFKEICDHSFEGISYGANSAALFRKLNMRHLRSRAAEIQAAGQSLAQFYNFQPINSMKWVPGAVILSQGQLPKVQATVGSDELGLFIGQLAVAGNTYGDVINSLGLKRGDQLTFVTVEKILGEYKVKLARVILDPRNDDGSGAPLSTAFVTEGAITKPSRRNQGAFTYLTFANDAVNFCLGPNGATLVAAAVIVSRKDGDEWLRSNAELAISEAACGSDLMSLYDSIEASYVAADIDLESENYLNNAGVGGAQGETQEPATPSTDPVYNNNVSINGVSQNVSGGSVAVTAPLESIVITGNNLSDSPARVTVDDGNAIFPTKTATTLSVTGLSAQAGSVVKVFKNEGVLWFTINVQAAGGSGDGPDSD